MEWLEQMSQLEQEALGQAQEQQRRQYNTRVKMREFQAYSSFSMSIH